MRSITPDEFQTMTYTHVFANNFHEFLRDGYDLALHTLQGEFKAQHLNIFKHLINMMII
jgi:hypothetical protein